MSMNPRKHHGRRGPSAAQVIAFAEFLVAEMHRRRQSRASVDDWAVLLNAYPGLLERTVSDVADLILRDVPKWSARLREVVICSLPARTTTRFPLYQKDGVIVCEPFAGTTPWGLWESPEPLHLTGRPRGGCSDMGVALENWTLTRDDDHVFLVPRYFNSKRDEWRELKRLA